MLVLTSYYYIRNPEWYIRLQEAGASVLVDSGAFSVHNKLKQGYEEAEKVRDGMQEYLDDYMKFCHEVDGRVTAYFNCDTEGTQEQSDEIEAIMQADGLNPIPVWHGDCKTWDGFEEWLRGHEYVAIGGNVTGGNITATPHYDVKRMAAFMKRVNRVQPGTKIHLLGEARPRVLKKLGPYSSDSISTTSYYRHPGAKLKIFNPRTRRWYELEKEPEDWSDMDAISSLLDIVQQPSLKAVEDLTKEYSRYQTSLQEVAIYAGWYAWSQYLNERGRTKVYSVLDIKHKLANIALVGWMAGWLDKSFLDWITQLPSAAEVRKIKKAGEKANGEGDDASSD